MLFRSFQGWNLRSNIGSDSKFEDLSKARNAQVTVSVMQDEDVPACLEPHFVFGAGTENGGPPKHDYVASLFVTNPDPDLLQRAALDPHSWEAKVFAYPRGVQETERWVKYFDANAEASDLQVSRERSNLLMCGCMHNWPWRVESMNKLKENGFPCDSDCGRYEHLMLTSKFVFSPRGHGWQSHRDWEAIFNGAVPLLDAREHYDSALWAGLPVVLVEDWTTVTPAFLEATWDAMATRDYDLSKAYWPWWLEHLRTAGRHVKFDKTDPHPLNSPPSPPSPSPPPEIATHEVRVRGSSGDADKAAGIVPRDRGVSTAAPQVPPDIVLVMHGFEEKSIDLYDKALGRWLDEELANSTVFTSEVAQSFHGGRFTTVGILGQSRGWPGRKFEFLNTDGDNKPLEMILYANSSFHRPFQWLVVGDDDTCFSLGMLRSILSEMNSSALTYMGYGQKPSSSIYNMQCCPDVGLTMSHWVYGGLGYVLSRGLLDAIRPSEWQWCIDNLSRGGGDVRVGACIEKWTAVVPKKWPKSCSFHRSVDLCDLAEQPAG